MINEASSPLSLPVYALLLVATVLTGRWAVARLQRLLVLGVRGGDRVVAFFHPYCDSGGGGERVLWVAIEAVLREEGGDGIVAIYNGGERDIDTVLRTVVRQFRIDLTKFAGRIRLVNIASRTLLEARWYPVATMICQSLASIVVGLECLARLAPDLYVDTTGAAFTYPLFRVLGGAKVVCYVHYPIISSDMLARVREQRPSYNNDARIAQSVTTSYLKLVYYKCIAVFYSIAGFFACSVVVNSSWTEGHISELWGCSLSQDEERGGRLTRIFPPCNTTTLLRGRSDASKRENVILSVGQFRAEKDHALQLEAFALLCRDHAASPGVMGSRLVLLGGARHAEDEELVRVLRLQTEKLGIANRVEFLVNAPFEQLQDLLSKATAGLHTMWNEHFGISVVEMLAAGLVVVAHNSGGPRMDIVVPHDGPDAVGFLATTPQEYAACLARALGMSQQDAAALRLRARESVRRFSDEAFATALLKVLSSNKVKGQKMKRG